MWPSIWRWVRRHQWQLLALFIGVLVPLFIFGSLAEDVVEREPFFFDVPLLQFLHGHSTPILDQVMLFFSLIGFRFGLVPVDIAGLIYLIYRRRRGDALFWALGVGGAALLNLAAKPTFGRIRPDLWLSLAPESSFSFPSGHAMGTMALVATLVVLTWNSRWRCPVFVLGGLFVLLVGVSRVYLGVHYPSDIMAGWTASLAWVLGLSLIFYRQITKPTPKSEPIQ